MNSFDNIYVTNRKTALAACIDILNDYIKCVTLNLPENFLDRKDWRSLRMRHFFGNGRTESQIRQNIILFLWRTAGLEQQEKISLLVIAALEILDREIFPILRDLSKGSGGLNSIPIQRIRKSFIRNVPWRYKSLIWEYNRSRLPISSYNTEDLELVGPEETYILPYSSLLKNIADGANIEQLILVLGISRRNLFYQLEQQKEVLDGYDIGGIRS